MGLCPFPLKGQEQEGSEVQRLINAGQTEPLYIDQEEWEVESVGSWDGTVELAETVTVTLFSVGIARSRVVRRNDSVVVLKPLGIIGGPHFTGSARYKYGASSSQLGC